MSVALTAAQAAFKLSNSALQSVGESAMDQPKKTSSIWDRWPVVTSGSICLITTVQAVALGVIGNIGIGVILGISAVAAGILTIYLWSFSTLKDLEGYVEVFSERVTALAQTALSLTKSNEALVRTRIGMEEELKQRTAQFEEEKKAAAQALLQLKEASDSLRQTQQQVAQMGKILDSSHEVITEMTTKVGDFIQLNREISSTSQVLGGQLDSFKAIGERLESSTRALDEENQELLATKMKADDMARGLYAQFVQIAELFVGLKREREALDAGLSRLQKVDTSLATHTTDLHHVAEDLDKGAAEAQNIVDWMKQFDGIGDYIKDQMGGSHLPAETKK